MGEVDELERSETSKMVEKGFLIAGPRDYVLVP